METTHYVPSPAWEQVLQEPENSSSCLLLAFQDNNLVGWCRLFPTAGQVPPRLELGIGVLAHVRRIGIGKKLMDSGLRWAQRSGAGEIRLTTAVENAAAQSLFKRFGFTDTWQQGDRLEMRLSLALGMRSC